MIYIVFLKTDLGVKARMMRRRTSPLRESSLTHPNPRADRKLSRGLGQRKVSTDGPF
jgi:hypothetical protein